jgi:hypothetical protein
VDLTANPTDTASGESDGGLAAVWSSAVSAASPGGTLSSRVEVNGGLPAVGSCAVSAGGVKPVRSTPAGTALGWGEG